MQGEDLNLSDTIIITGCGLVLIGCGLFYLSLFLHHLRRLLLSSSDSSMEQKCSESIDHRLHIYTGEALRNIEVEPICVLLSNEAYNDLEGKDLNLWSVLICIMEQETA